MYLCEQNTAIMEIEIGTWVKLKSDTSKVYRVRGKSASDEILDCLSPQDIRTHINANDVEILEDEERLYDLDNQESAFIDLDNCQ